MKIYIQEAKFTIKPACDEKYPDLLAFVSMKLIDDHSRHFTVNGFTVRKSKYDGKPYLLPPSKSMGGKGFFKFVLSEKSLWREIEKEVVEQYQYESIPIIEEDKKP